MSRFILHTGLPKTGTASLQSSIFKEHPQIRYIGKINGTGIPRGCASIELSEALEPILWPSSRRPVSVETLQRARAALAAEAEDAQVTVGSWESLGIEPPKQFRRLLDNLVGTHDHCGVMLCVRNTVNWLPSLYLQETRGHFRRRNRKSKFGRRAYLSFNAWLNRSYKSAGGMDQWLCHVQNIKYAVNVLGRENVCVLTFEELCNDPQAYYLKIAQFLGIDNAETQRLSMGVHKNTRLCQAEYEHIQAVQSSFRRRWAWRFQDYAEIKAAVSLAKGANPDSPPVKPALDEQWRERINAVMQPEYQWLDATFGLGLAAQGYPVAPAEALS
jgi:hypothetical protein